MVNVKTLKWTIVPALVGLGFLVYQLPIFRVAACTRDFELPLVYRSTLSEQRSTPSPQRSQTLSEFQGDLVIKRTAFARLEGHFKPLLYKSGDVTSREFKSTNHRFRVRMNEQCLVTSLDFDTQESFGIRDHVMKLMTLLNMGRVAGLAEHDSFESTDFLGHSLFEKRKDEKGGLELQRRQVLKHPIPAAGDTSLTQVQRIISSSLNFAEINRSIWADRSSVDERFLVRSGSDQTLFNIRYVLHMQIIPTQGDLPIEQKGPPSSTVTKNIGERSRSYERPTMYSDLLNTPDLNDLATALKSFLEQLDLDAVKAKRMLIAYLKSHPQALEQLHDMIATETFSDHELVHVLFAVAKTGSPEAQKVLADLIGNDSLSLSTRLRVIFAVPEVPFAEGLLVSAIQEGSNRLKDPQASMDDLSSTSLLTAGILARNAIDIAPQVEAELKSDILEILKKNPNPAVKATVLDALGNYGNAELAPLVAEYVDAPSEVERIAAVRALVYLPSENREGLLVERLKIEEHANVRAALATTLSMTGIEHPSSVPIISSQLLTDKEATQRALATKVLGQAAERMPEARQALLKHSTHETDPQVLETAGRYLSAYELHAMRKREP